MVELMEYLYAQLSLYGETLWEDLDRDEEGKANIDNIKIVYNLPTELSITDNKCRTDLPLEINIWGKKDRFMDMEIIVEKINKVLNEQIYRGEVVFVVKKDNLYRINHQDVDKNIRRIQINYKIKLIKGEI